MIARRINAPWPYWRYFNLPIDRDLDKALAEIRQIINSFIAQARSRLVQNPELAQQPTNFLEAMLAWHDEDEAQFTDDEIFGNVFTMLLGGEDTTANTMTWMMHYMAVYPDVQRQMQAEVDAIWGDADLLEDIKVAEKLPYIEAVAQETMRLKPVAPLYFLETNQDVTVAGVQISKGTAVTLLARPGVMDQSNFEHAHEFRPERWLSGCPFHGAHNRAAHVPFGSGPRLCPGRSLALLEIKTAMAMICHHFDVTQVGDPQQVRERFAFAMMPTGLSVQFNPRRRDIAD